MNVSMAVDLLPELLVPNGADQPKNITQRSDDGSVQS